VRRYGQLALIRAALPGEAGQEGIGMPRFMDYHDDLKLPPEAIAQIGQGARDGVSDEFGVRQIELYHNADGKVYCLLEAPDEDAVRRHHAALDVPCGEVHQVDSLL
jgi:Nickel responsive protein SCO4226-like